jgi:dGTPase
MNIRERLEEREEQILSPYAQRSVSTRGRMRFEPECDIRPAFQHDRDRITHSKSFRRLKYKTQVFLSPGDHYRTRMTHTLEVSQVARTIGRALSLNEDLVEAISLGHDLGHTPFGHSGEEVLNRLYPEGFRHYEQSLRVVDILEKDGQGLNLTEEVRDGIVKHSKGKGDILINDDKEKPLTKEAEVVRIADIIAYINHDIDDAIRGNVLCENDIPRHLRDSLGHTVSDRIDTMVRGVISSTLSSVNMQLGCGRELESCMIEMRGYLYDFFLRDPDAFLKETGRDDFYDEPVTCVRDFIAGMTDRYAFSLFEKLFLPMPWSIPV